MQSYSRSFLLFATFFALPFTARAADYTVVGSGGGYSGSGTITATDQGGGVYLITGMSGAGFDGLFSPGGFDGNDNLLFPSAPEYVDGSGFSFTVTNGADTDNVNIFSTANGYEAYLVDEGGNQDTIPVTFTLTAASSPTTSMATVRRALRSMAVIAPATTQFSFSFAATPQGTQSVPQTPEPASFVLLGTGAAAMLTAARRRIR